MSGEQIDLDALAAKATDAMHEKQRSIEVGYGIRRLAAEWIDVADPGTVVALIDMARRTQERDSAPRGGGYWERTMKARDDALAALARVESLHSSSTWVDHANQKITVCDYCDDGKYPCDTISAIENGETDE